MLKLKNQKIGMRAFHFIIVGEYMRLFGKLINKTTENRITMKSLDI